MLKTFKWIYKLGVKHERRRIAAFLQTAQNRRYDHINMLEREYKASYRLNGEEGTVDEIKVARIKEQQAVDEAIIDIIDQLFTPNPSIERGESVMFPGEEEL